MEKNNLLVMKSKHFSLVVTALVIGGIGFLYYAPNAVPGKYDDFAQCLSDAGAKEYGAYWCPNCQEQKKLFGKSFKHVNYIECASGRGQTATCQKAGIEAYPTWEFKDGSREVGMMTLKELSAKTGCALPKEHEDTDAPAAPESTPVTSSAPEPAPAQ